MEWLADVRFLAHTRIYIIATTLGPTRRLTQPLVYWAMKFVMRGRTLELEGIFQGQASCFRYPPYFGVIFTGIKWSERETGHFPSTADVKYLELT
jgi:hypothetical protein